MILYISYREAVVRVMEPVKLVKDIKGNCECPHCKQALRYIEAQPVRIVNGKLNLEDSEAHYECEKCNLLFRRVVHTEYFQCYNK